MAAMDTLNEEFLTDYENRCFQDQIEWFRERKRQLHSARLTSSELEIGNLPKKIQLNELDYLNRKINYLNVENEWLKKKSIEDKKKTNSLNTENFILLKDLGKVEEMLRVLREEVETVFFPVARSQGKEKGRIDDLLSKSKFVFARSEEATKCLNSIKMELLQEETDQGDILPTAASTASIVATSGATELMTVGEESASGTDIKTEEEDALNVAFLFDYEINGFAKLVEIFRHQNRQLHSTLETVAKQQEEDLRLQNKLSEVKEKHRSINDLTTRNEEMKKKAITDEKQIYCLKNNNLILWEDRRKVKEILRELAMKVTQLLVRGARIPGNEKDLIEDIKKVLSEAKQLLKRSNVSNPLCNLKVELMQEKTATDPEDVPSAAIVAPTGAKELMKLENETLSRNGANSGTNGGGGDAATYVSTPSKSRNVPEAHTQYERLPLDKKKKQRDLRGSFLSRDDITKKSKFK